MGILQMLGRQKEKKNLGVCIPETHKKKREKRVEENAAAPTAFKVTGIFAYHDSMMLEGIMIKGVIETGSEIEIQGKKLKVLDVSVEKRPAEKIEPGQKGALFFRTKSCPIVKVGDLIEFE